MNHMLAIYLNDHLCGATAGVELARRTAGAHRRKPAGRRLAQIATEVDEDRDALLQVMRELDVPVRQYKVYAGWAAEKLGRLKFNGHLTQRSPLSDLLELEGLRLGVEGKRALWRTLRALGENEARLPVDRLDRLVARAERQIEALEELRLETGTQVFTSG